MRRNGMVKAIEDGVKTISAVLHLVKPIVLEVVLFVVFMMETWHWLQTAVFGE
jgi:hypothetical protein